MSEKAKSGWGMVQEAAKPRKIDRRRRRGVQGEQLSLFNTDRPALPDASCGSANVARVKEMFPWRREVRS